MDKGMATALLLIAVIPTAVAAHDLRDSFFDDVLTEDRKTGPGPTHIFRRKRLSTTETKCARRDAL